MTKQTFAAYFAKFPIHSYKKDWPIVNAGDKLKKIFYLKKGYVRLYSISSEGKDLTLIVYKPGDFFPLFTALLPNVPYRYWVEAMTPCEIVAVPVESFVSFFKQNPQLLLDMTIKIMIRFDGALRRMEYLAFGTAAQRLTSIIVILGERFGKKVKEGLFIEVPLTHKDLANLVGITRETASVVLGDLRKRGLIDYEHQHITVKNLPKLTKKSLIV